MIPIPTKITLISGQLFSKIKVCFFFLLIAKEAWIQSEPFLCPKAEAHFIDYLHPPAYF